MDLTGSSTMQRCAARKALCWCLEDAGTLSAQVDHLTTGGGDTEDEDEVAPPASTAEGIRPAPANPKEYVLRLTRTNPI